MKSKILVAHTEPVLAGDHYDWRVRNVRNITIHHQYWVQLCL